MAVETDASLTWLSTHDSWLYKAKSNKVTSDYNAYVDTDI